jgi:hypothetical protein
MNLYHCYCHVVCEKWYLYSLLLLLGIQYLTRACVCECVRARMCVRTRAYVCASEGGLVSHVDKCIY